MLAASEGEKIDLFVLGFQPLVLLLDGCILAFAEKVGYAGFDAPYQTIHYEVLQGRNGSFWFRPFTWRLPL